MSSVRQKALLKQAKGKEKKKEQVLNDADDYLEAASEHEDAMGKHRGGNAEKSLRFAHRALDIYTQGVAKFPSNFDLAYNKARLELEIGTHPALVEVLDVPVLNLLRQALDSHQSALKLEPENADTLFNTAQVLTAIAEHIAEEDSIPDTEALQCLEQALDYQRRCFEIQQKSFAQSRQEFEQAMRENAEHAEHDHQDGGASLGQESNSTTGDQDEEEQWVSVVEPVTADSLIDTIIAQVNTLTTLCSIINSILAQGSTPPVSQAWIESYSTKLLTGTLVDVIKENHGDLKPRLSEVSLAKAVFTSNFLELAFRSNAIDAQSYKNELDGAFSQSDLDAGLEEVLLAGARALISFNGALADAATTSGDGSQSSLRWSILYQAQSRLTMASKLPSVATDNQALATTHALRGDISLLLHTLSYPPIAYPQAQGSKEQLLKNAEVYYRNAGKLFGTLGSAAEEDKEACDLKGGVVKVLQLSPGSSSTGGPTMAPQEAIHGGLGAVAQAKGEAWIRDQLDDLVGEGLVVPQVFGLQ